LLNLIAKEIDMEEEMQKYESSGDLTVYKERKFGEINTIESFELRCVN
jgi:hypothetical protein